MLLLEEILDAQKLRRAVGQHASGHFDHDARLAIGPPYPLYVDEPTVRGAASNETITGVETGSTAVGVKYEQSEDPRTGELLFRPVGHR